MDVMSLARQEGYDLTVVEIFEQIRIIDLALALRQAKLPVAKTIAHLSLLPGLNAQGTIINIAAEQCKVQKTQIQDLYRTTPIQEGLLSLTAKDQSMYVRRLVFQLPDFVKVDRFKTAWEAMVEVNPILRTRIIQAEFLHCFEAVLRNVIV